LELAKKVVGLLVSSPSTSLRIRVGKQTRKGKHSRRSPGAMIGLRHIFKKEGVWKAHLDWDV